MRYSITSIRDWYFKYERRISSVSLVVGFAFDAIIFTQVNLFWESVLISTYLFIVALCIILIHATENKTNASSGQPRLHFWLMTLLQFFFGGLLSIFLVSYFRSSTLAVAWPFLLMLAIALVANEGLKKHYARLTFQISFFFLALFSFSVYFLPVLFHRIGPAIFLVSGITSIAILWLFILLLRAIARENFARSKRSLIVSILSIFTVMNALYFLNLIPPIPLSLKDSGIYHSIYRNESGNYVLTGEETGWLDFLSPYADFHAVPADSAYAYSAIFSPSSFTTAIVHEWQRYDEDADVWVTAGTIPLSIVGGRSGGYRVYSIKNNITPGKWRVNVATSRGQVIGRMRLNVIATDTEPIVQTSIKD